MEPKGAETAAYAAALAELGRAAGRPLDAGRELAEVLGLLERDSRINDFLADPGVAAEGKAAALRDLLAGRVHPVLLHFLLMILDQGEWRRLPAIAEEYFEAAGRRSGHAAGEVTTALPLTEAQVAAIEEALAGKFRRTVKLHTRVDPRVIGGVSVRVGDVILDGTVARRLEQVREALVQA